MKKQVKKVEQTVEEKEFDRVEMLKYQMSHSDKAARKQLVDFIEDMKRMVESLEREATRADSTTTFQREDPLLYKISNVSHELVWGLANRESYLAHARRYASEAAMIRAELKGLENREAKE